MGIPLRPVERVEILALQDNYIDMTAADNNAVVTRANPLKEGAFRASIMAEHGLSALITVSRAGETYTLLFDFGFSEHGAAQNAVTLGVDLSTVEAAALSHGHGDHIGGMKALGTLMGERTVPLVLHPAAFKYPRYLKVGPERRINFPRLTRTMIADAGFSPLESREPYPLMNDTILFLGEIPRRTDFERGFPIAFWENKGREEWDAIEDDSSLVIHLREKGLIVISGCAHAGIINTVHHAIETTGVNKVHAVLGGFHLTGPLFEPIIDRTIDELFILDPNYVIPMHCTGRKATIAMENRLGNKFILNMAGTKLTFV